MSLLINEPPLMVLPSLAAELGTADEAIVLQQLHYWLQHSNNVRDGHKWVYNSISDWLKQFPWIKSRKRLTRYFDDLEARGLVVTGNYNKAAFDKTKWYRIDYDALSALEKRLGQNDPTSESNRPNGEGQNDPTNTNRLPETTTETNNNSRAKPDKGPAYLVERKEIVAYLNNKLGTNYRAGAKKNKERMNARLNEGYTVDDFKRVIDNKYTDWADSPKMARYLRPETLFSPKFESYLNEKQMTANDNQDERNYAAELEEWNRGD